MLSCDDLVPLFEVISYRGIGREVTQQGIVSLLRGIIISALFFFSWGERENSVKKIKTTVADRGTWQIGDLGAASSVCDARLASRSIIGSHACYQKVD